MDPPIRILHLEDDPSDAELIRAKLTAEDPSCAIVWADAKAAFESALARQPFDLVLIDYDLPGYGGMAALARVREERPEPPVIVLSGALGEEAAVECIKAGATDFVLKQQLHRLGAAVRAALERSRLARAAREAENALRESEARFRTLAEMSSDWYWEQDRELRLSFHSSSFAQHSGTTSNKLLGKCRWEEPNRFPLSGTWDEHRATLEAHEPFRDFEYFRIGDDGGQYFASLSGMPVYDAAGNFNGYRGVGTNITERKRAEQALRESEERLRAIFEGVLDGILVADAESGTFLTGNPAIGRMLGYSLEEIVRLCVPDIHPEQDLPHALDQFERLRRGEIQLAADIPMLRKDGSVFYADIKAARVLLGGKNAMLGIFRDVTERRQAFEKIARLNRVYAISSGINALIVRASDRDELFEEACRIAVEAGRFRMSWIGLVDRNAMKIRPVASAGSKPEYMTFIEDQFSLREDASMGNTLTARAIREKKPFYSNDTQNDPSVRFKKEHLEIGTRSIAVLPLIVSDEAVGVLVLYTEEAGFFDEQELKLLTELAGDIAFALGHIENANKLDYLAYYDSVTGLANRTLFHERLSQFVHTAQQGQGKLALVLADVERFKTINDSLGRQAGDELLKQLAVRLGRAAKPGNIARIGADHFAIVLPEMKGRSEVGRTVQAIWHDWFGQAFRVGDTELRVVAKAGIALFPNDGADVDTLFANAEAALQKAQETGERHQFHSRDLTEGVAEQFTLVNKLRQALENDEFVLYYQPKVDVEARRIVGVEALIRWQSPELGLVPPMKFIPLMEETGLILPVGSWALKQASLDHQRWVDQGLKAPRVAVNVSPIQLRQRNFVAAVEEAIMEGVAPTGIDLEITESLVMEDVQGNIEKLKSVCQLGVKIAIDDFGTGYSSLGYLAKLPVQSLKIDRSFIITMLNDPDTMTLVSTIISLAHSLRLKVVAEGVDAEEQAKYLRLLRCDEMQGYLFSRPLPFDEMTVLLGR